MSLDSAGKGGFSGWDSPIILTEFRPPEIKDSEKLPDTLLNAPSMLLE
jgi:hypothetical protein